MTDYIENHALNNVWCSSDQTKHHIFKLTRVTSSSGAIGSAQVMMKNISLPTTREKYHVFQIRYLSSSIVTTLRKGVTWQTPMWNLLSDIVVSSKAYINIYSEKGVQIPWTQNYYMVMTDGTLLFAVKDSSKIPIDLVNENIYFRFYVNSYFNSSKTNSSDEIRVEGHVYQDQDSFLVFQNRYNIYAAKRGLMLAFKNGLLVKEIKLSMARSGDIFEWLYDTSVETVVDIQVSHMKTFESILDTKSKMLFIYKAENINKITYHEDIDFYVYFNRPETGLIGSYYHKNLEEACRMVTHCAYSLPTQHINTQVSYLENLSNQTTLNSDEVFIKAIIRRNLYTKPLIYNHNRLFELYKLPEDLIEASMVGSNATVDLWKAEELENSAYCALMRSKPENITKQMLQDTYGFNGMSKILADTPILTKNVSGKKQIDVPAGLKQNSTFFEYNAEGELIGFYNGDGNDIYVCRNYSAKYVEILTGIGTNTPDFVFTKTETSLPTTKDYRVYKIHDFKNTVIDVTGSNIYSIQDGKIVTNLSGTSYSLVVKTDLKFLCYEIEITPTSGDFSFTLAQRENRTGEVLPQVLRFPPRYWDIFLNGKMLIEGIDYVVTFPRIRIISKKHIKQPATTTAQKITVRGIGFCYSDMTWKKPDMVGFVEHDFLLNNSKYDIEDDKVQNITVGGYLKHKSEVKFSDDHFGISVVNDTNGLPYRINNTYVSLSDYSVDSSQTLMDRAEENDRIISAYLTSRIPEPERNSFSAIDKRYDLYSPFVSTLLEDLEQGDLDPVLEQSPLTDSRVIEICSKYEPILTYDPTQPEYALDSRYMVVHPTIKDNVINLTLLQYRFIRKAVELYCHGTLNLAETVTFS